MAIGMISGPMVAELLLIFFTGKDRSQTGSPTGTGDSQSRQFPINNWETPDP
jgi:hypothetical protein